MDGKTGHVRDEHIMHVPTSTTIVGFGYKARHGKDTAVAEIIKQRSDKYIIKRYAFADELKREVNEDLEGIAAFLQLDLDPKPDMSDPLCPKGKHSVVLQGWGEYRRRTDPFYWLRHLANKVVEEAPQFALVSDCRHLNELYYIVDNKGFTVKVERVGFIDPSRPANHVTEVALDAHRAWDFHVQVGNGDLQGLKKDAILVFDLIVAQLNRGFDQGLDFSIPLAA